MSSHSTTNPRQFVEYTFKVSLRYLTRIPPLLSFLLQYSIFNGFIVDTCVYLAPEPLRKIESSCGFAAKKTIELLIFKENLCLHLLHLHEKGRKSHVELWGPSVETAEFHGILGFLIASVMRSSQASQYSDEMIAIAQNWRERKGQFSSTMLAFAQNLLFVDGPPCTLDKADMQVKFTMAMAMVELNDFAPACALLNSCAKDLRSTYSVYEDEYFPVMTELIKCCNILHQEEQGEATAFEALHHRYSDTATRNEICSIQIELADSFIGRSKYSEAEKVLQQILDGKTISTYLKTVACLRLNKVRRRLGVFDVSTVTHSGALGKALTYLNDSKGDIRDECSEELSCTISFAQQRTTENAAAAKAIFENASAIVARQPVSTSNWRTRILCEQVAYESHHGRSHPTNMNVSPAESTHASTGRLAIHNNDCTNGIADISAEIVVGIDFGTS